MIHELTDSYCFWLECYCKRAESPHKKTALQLIDKLKLVTSIETLQKALTLDDLRQPLLPEHTKEIQFFSLAQPDPFFKQINHYKATVEELIALDKKSLMDQLDHVETPKAATPLIALIKEVLADERTLLHDSVLSLVRQLQKKGNLSAIVVHLAAQPVIAPPDPATVRRGSFETIRPITPQHEGCLNLLRNNSATFSDINPISQAANDLLQVLVNLYHDVHADSPKTADTPGCCSLS